MTSYYSQGFTIIELLVVFSVLIVISGVGLVSFSNYSNTQSLNQAREDVLQFYKVAKFNAVSSVKPDLAQCNSSTISQYKMQLCAKTGSCLSTDTYEMDAVCGSQTVKIQSKKLPATISLGGATTCTTVTYNIQTGITTGLPCAVELSGYGQTLTFNP